MTFTVIIHPSLPLAVFRNLLRLEVVNAMEGASEVRFFHGVGTTGIGLVHNEALF
jgi:hypothetical protein